MNVLVSVNRGYMRHFYVMLASLVGNTECPVRVFVLHDDLTKEDEDRTGKLFPEIKFDFIFMDKAVYEGFPTVKRYPRTVYYRIFAPLALPDDVDRVLYLDCDLVLHNSIDGFYRTDFCGNYFVACTNAGKLLTLLNRIRLLVGRNHVYMNTGVLLMNVKALKGVMNEEAIRRYTVKNRYKLMLYDQDILCKFYGDRVLLEDKLKYNLSDRHLSRHNAFKRNKITEDWVENNNVIVHYIGTNKPWKDGYRGVLDRYYKQSERALDARICSLNGGANEAFKAVF